MMSRTLLFALISAVIVTGCGERRKCKKRRRLSPFRHVAPLQGASATFLAASRSVNGSGEVFARNFDQVHLALETARQGWSLAAKFDELRAELLAVRRELRKSA